jgi:hypothetical protein
MIRQLHEAMIPFWQPKRATTAGEAFSVLGFVAVGCLT